LNNVSENVSSSKDQKINEIRRNQITLLVKALYRKFDILHNRSEKELIEKALTKYLNSALSIDEISDDMLDIIANMENKKISQPSNNVVTSGNTQNEHKFEIQKTEEPSVNETENLESMFKDLETSSKNEEESHSKNEEKPKQFVMNNNSSKTSFAKSNDGFTNLLLVVFIILVIVVLFLLGFLLLKIF